ncbi:MAG: Diadenosine tetraphosphate (Ap4A) hydrolaseHIT [Candidatus Moranbacteria bacterium GW2011_GWF2_36_839]|nr:MAG: Diadenosine tetraphosphate (Ap4A) hydrolaseHIT [Candidatus Moranbacteria bacterium GW2011_GWF1_36_78]KKQ16303.1 MAG: Diadenosine tetraphosphate (Ap4A) hydrolaseHIT [Candidatus Moranbacteria bacterium GW2011_GWF2_36_839]HAT74181.1 diadenosine tetraphosphate hydrolase [Candidatus Moranbacteria bacterium]HBY10636.1 diadenosine tetraphosphate hydrolase [Candidatus Moranbacteria bacterium]
MYNHSPENYKCPICPAINGIENEDTWIRQADIVYRDDVVTVFIGSKFVKNNPGHPIIVPNAHYENIYDLPENISCHIAKIAKKVALSLKIVRKCEGITITQNNEPIGDQHAFHYHMHVFPRFADDNLCENMTKASLSKPEERLVYAEELRKIL